MRDVQLTTMAASSASSEAKAGVTASDYTLTEGTEGTENGNHGDTECAENNSDSE